MSLSSTPERLKCSTGLNIPLGEQNELVHRIRALTRELDESPVAVPDRDKNVFRAIGIRRPSRDRPGAYMSIESIEPPGKRPRASIVITDRSRDVGNSAISFHYRPSLDVWDEWRPSQDEPYSTRDNSDMVRFLDSQVPAGTLNGLQDHAPSAIEIVHVLTSQLGRKARTRERTRSYSSSRIIIGGKDYATAADSRFEIKQKNSRTEQRLAIAATYLTDMGTIDTTYSYEVIETRRELVSAKGILTVSTAEEMPLVRLRGYALGYKKENPSVEYLNYAIKDLRQGYYLPK